VGAKNAKNGSEAEPKEVEHGGKVIADQILILLISKADRIMTRHSLRFRNESLDSLLGQFRELGHGLRLA
jgi:hypothetical protein